MTAVNLDREIKFDMCLKGKAVLENSNAAFPLRYDLYRQKKKVNPISMSFCENLFCVV